MSDFGRCDVQLDKTKTERKSQNHFEKGPTNSRFKDRRRNARCGMYMVAVASGDGNNRDMA